VDPWIEPQETERATWGVTDSGPESPPSVYERAHAAARPYERYESLTLAGPDVQAAFESAAYDHAKLHYHIAVDSAGRVKLLSKGHLWGPESDHQRFRIQYRREAEPTETPPFDEYDAWARFRTGRVERDGDGLTFEADPDRTRERTMTLSWPEMFATDQLRLAEAELVRNPPLARYVLSTQDLWADVRDTLRYHPAAFESEG
jgi:hypothetical protein